MAALAHIVEKQACIFRVPCGHSLLRLYKAFIITTKSSGNFLFPVSNFLAM